MDNIIFIDFETYYDRNYDLRRLTTIEYILDPRFKVLGCAIAENDGPAYWIDGEELPDLDWENSEVVAHNNFFDGQILTLRYGIKAKRWSCTQSIARALLPVKSHSLKSVTQLLALGAKTEGLTEGSKESDTKLIDYAINDVELCRKIYNKLIRFIPEPERELLHLTLRWGIDPRLQLDVEMLEAAYHEAIDQRNQAIESSGLSKEELTSQQKFEKWMIEQGIEVPYKTSNSTGWTIPALSKNDPKFHALRAKHPELEHVWLGRIAAKSNILIKRAEKLLQIARLTEQNLMPMPLNYCGAGTQRWSGKEINVQNLPRSSAIRSSIIAPKGHVIVVADSAQIELRVNAWYAGEQYILDLLGSGGDAYKDFAQKRFNLTEITKDQRQFGKASVLGLGYGMGAVTFKDYCASGPIGLAPILISEEDAIETVNTYRRANANIARNWKRHDQAISAMWSGTPLKIGPVVFGKEHAMMPNGLAMQYPNLKPSEEGWTYGYENETRIYGAKLVENIVQCLARIIIAEQILEIEKAGIRTVSSTHDEVIAVCPIEEAEVTYQKMQTIMSSHPEWAEGIILDASGGYATNYSK